ncbi:hypothetical protein ACFXK0_07195 [Nocardia sp. NPDC059177]|uniref:hypothetical protein n=1 Tax=Nocardia sp. NPDC059177 TaxID=3346759 RepID=UPI003681EE87
MRSVGRELLDEVENMSVPQRMRTLAARARQLAGTPELDQLLAAVDAEGPYGRWVAGYLARIGGGRQFLLARLDSSDQDAAGAALTALIRLGIEPRVLVDRLPAMSKRVRYNVFRALGRGDNTELADTLLPRVRSLFGDVEAARVLPSCSAAVVAHLLPDLAYTVPSWNKLGGKHIGVVFDYVQARAAGADRAQWQELWWRLTANPIAAATHDPDRLLALAGVAVRYVSVAQLNPVAGMLARHDIAAVRRLVLHPSGHGRGLAGPALWRALQVLPDDDLRELYLACPAGSKQQFLHTMPPSRRAALAAADLVRPGLAPAAVDVALLDELPGPARHAVADELLARPGGADIPEVADRLTARLPWTRARPVLVQATRRPTADERARAYPLLITAAAGTRDPAVLTDLLTLLTRLRNEQDPVRSSALQALAGIPMSLLTTEHLPALEQLATDALQARDRSWTTIHAVGRLTRTLLLRGGHTGDPAFTDTSLRVITQLAALSSAPNLRGLHHNLPRGAEHRIFAALLDRLTADADRDIWYLCLATAEGLAHRACNIPALQALLVRACRSASDATVCRAVPLALAAPDTRDTHLDAMLAHDRSLITLPIVQQHIGSRRTDLLVSLLDTTTPGRFLPDSVRFVPMSLGGFRRWSPQHIDRYARLLDDYARGRATQRYEQAAAVRQLGRLPGSLARVRRFVDHDDVVVAEAALTALGGSDQPEDAVAILAAYVGDDRARVAVSSIAACAPALPPERISVAVAPLLGSRKITAVKEGIRLLASLRAPDAATVITELALRPDAHRDVRRAAVFGTRFLLDQEAAWTLLDRVAADPEVASAILEIRPFLLPIPQRPRFAAFVRDLAAQPDPRVAGPALAALSGWQRWAAPGTDAVIIDQLTDLDRVGVWQAAMQALLAGVRQSGEPTALSTAVTRLRADGFTAPGRDLPAHQRLSSLLHWFVPLLRNYDEIRPLAAPIAELVATDPLWHDQVIQLTVVAIRWEDPAGVVATFDRIAAYATGALIPRPAHHLAQRLPDALTSTAPEVLHTISAELSTRPAPSTALAALAIVTQCGPKFGWSTDWLDILTRLRAHPDPDVRRTAHTVFTEPE